MGARLCRAAVIYFPPRRRGIRVADISESIFGIPPLLYGRHVSGYSITCDVTDSVQRSLFYTGTYEPAATRLIRQHLREHDVFVDVGANADHFRFLAASIVGPSGHVHAIEASPSTAERLVADVVSNKLDDTVTIHRTAAFDESGVAVIVEDVGSPHRIGGRHLDRSADDGETVSTVRLDDLLINVTPQVIKVDVEGADLRALHGARTLIETRKPRLVIAEAEPPP